MTDPTPDPIPTESTTPPAPPAPASTPTFEQRMDSFGRDVGAAGERLGREAEAAGHGLANDPTFQRAGDTAARVWGLIVLAVGLWFLADVTLELDMPVVPWGDVWPLGLILLGAVIVVRGMGRRRA